MFNGQAQESHKDIETPQTLVDYKEWWSKTYGRDITQAEHLELIGFARELAKTDDDFRKVLSEQFVAELTENEDGIENPKKRRFLFTTALSTYARKFGLNID